MTMQSDESVPAAPLINKDDAQHVVAACGCTLSEATDLLKRSNYDRKVAIDRYGIIKSSMPKSKKASISKSPNRTTPSNEEPFSPYGIPQGGWPSNDLSLDEAQDARMRPEIPGPSDTKAGEDCEDTGLQLKDMSVEKADEPEWDYILPQFLPSVLTSLNGNEEFDVEDLIASIQSGVNLNVVKNYLGYYDKGLVRKGLNSSIQGFPSIFFAVATNDDHIIRTWVSFGAEVSAVCEKMKLPLLAFAIMQSDILGEGAIHTVKTLLSLGASPEVIPSAFYTPFCQDLPDTGPDDESLKIDIDDENKAWCTPVARARLARTANLAQRYNLERASKMKRPSARRRQIAKSGNAEPLLAVPYFLVGQDVAAKSLMQNLLGIITVSRREPLVLVFAGPSGHGKTELARQLGNIMSLSLQVVDCTIFSRENELFGPRHPYIGCENGTPLNNFLSRNAGQRCIVFLDEFEKTTREIHQALLLPFDNGEYQDRRTSAKVDCSQTMWILATNALDPTITKFYAQHEEKFHNDQAEKLGLVRRLSKELKEDFLSKFGAPVTGRISGFIPFLPFSLEEQAVVTHKFLLELGEKIRRPINLKPGGNQRLLGNVQMSIRKDASVCRALAETEYNPNLGARSLISAAKIVEQMLVEAYLDVEDEVEERPTMADFVVSSNNTDVMANLVHPR